MQRIINAVFRNHLDELRSAISEGLDVNEQDNDGRTALIHAAIDNRVDAASILIDANAKINIQDKLGNTALHYASQDFHLGMAELLVQRGALVDLVDMHGNSPLWRAVFNSKGRGEMIALLLSAGADKHQRNNHGKSPIELAKSISNYNVLQFLS